MMRNTPPKTVDASADKTDARLVVEALGGDKSAFVEIVARHQTMVCGVAFGILNDFAASEDAAQEAFFTAWRKLKELRDPAQLRAWLAQIARNAALTNLRRRRSEAPLADDFDATDQSLKPDEAAAADEDHLLVQNALAQLPEPYRVPLVLFYCEGRSTRSVAEALGTTDDAIRQRLSRGREMLRAQIEGRIETVLESRRPTALFTMAIAAGIGALAAPATVAAGAFSSAASPLSSLFSAMSASKTLTATAAAIVLISIPVGYHFGPKQAVPAKPEALHTPAVEIEPDENRRSIAESPLIAEWRALREKHSDSPEPMRAIYAAIQELNDPLRQSAFTTALISEWIDVDPHAAVAFFSDKKRPWRERQQVFRAWFVADPRQALASVPFTEPWESSVRDSLKEAAQRVPDVIADVVQRLPKKESFYDSSVRDAFGVLAERDVKSARSLAEKIEGPNQDEALAGVAAVWARTDLDAAVEWARQVPGDADEVLRAALIGVAAVDPVAALERMNSVPPGGREAHGNSTTGARVLQAAARTDFATTVTWLKEHPGGLSREDVLGLSEAVTDRLLENPGAFLTEHANSGSLPVLVEPIQSALMNRADGMIPAVWKWLQEQPTSDTIQAIRSSVLDTSSWHNPDFALELVKELEPTPRGEAEVKDVAQALLNGGHELKRFERLYANAPERLRAPLVEQAFRNLSPEYMDSPETWLSRVALLPEEKRAEGIGAVAGAWARESPEEAGVWAALQPEGEARRAAISKIAPVWVKRDEASARAWMERLTAAERNAAEESIKAAAIQ